MTKREQWNLNEESAASALNRKEITSIFIDTLTDIYSVKSHLLDYLPSMAQTANAKALKLAILDTSIDVRSQLIRLDTAMSILKEQLQLTARDNFNDFNLNSYLRSTLSKADPYTTDIALLTHLIMIETIQVATFTMMKQMSHAFENKAIHDLIRDNLNDATENLVIFKAMMNAHLAPAIS